VEKYLKSAGEANPVIPEPMKKLVGQYLEEGFPWFIFDVVQLQSAVRTTDAIEYRFKTDSLYYPLKISSTGDGNSQIDLVVLSRSKLRIESVSGQWRQLHRVLTVSESEVSPISSAITSLFTGEPGIMLRQWRIGGRLDAFDKDLKAVPRPPRAIEEW